MRVLYRTFSLGVLLLERAIQLEILSLLRFERFEQFLSFFLSFYHCST